jgi:hypothetical protein
LIDADGNYTGELSFYAYGPHKATAIRELAARDGIDLADSYAYSDSVTDVPPPRVIAPRAVARGASSRPLPPRASPPFRSRGRGGGRGCS